MTMNFRLPGPTPLPPPVVAALGRDMIPHRGPEFRELFRAKRDYDETIARLSTPPQTAPRPTDPEELKAWNAQRVADRMGSILRHR